MATLKINILKTVIFVLALVLALSIVSIIFNFNIFPLTVCLFFMAAIVIILIILFFAIRRNAVPKSSDEIWRRKIANMLGYDYNYRDDIPKIVAYYKALIQLYPDFKIFNQDIVDEMHAITSVELRGTYSAYPIKILFDEFSYMHIIIKTDSLPYFLQVNKQSGLFRESAPLSEMEQNIKNAEIVYDFQTELFETALKSRAMAHNPMLAILHDPEKIPSQKEAGDVWAENDISRIFIAQGIYFLSSPNLAEVYQLVFNTFPDSFRKEIFDFFRNNLIYSLEIEFEQIKLTISDKVIGKKPITLVEECFKMLLKLATQTLSLPVAVKDGRDTLIKAEKFRIVRCTYCSSNYILKEACKCPNCGASF